jgi:hypothetical protein|tara:strand:- start:21699 stop:21851 length:153 start_codon:yes stop_codon:yes gene_type:complete
MEYNQKLWKSKRWGDYKKYQDTSYIYFSQIEQGYLIRQKTKQLKQHYENF